MSKPCIRLKFRTSYSAQSIDSFFIDDPRTLAKNQNQIKIFYIVAENSPTVTINHLKRVLLKHSDLLKGKCPYLLSIWISLPLSLSFLMNSTMYIVMFKCVSINTALTVRVREGIFIRSVLSSFRFGRFSLL